jgi:hypothetical protein
VVIGEALSGRPRTATKARSAERQTAFKNPPLFTFRHRLDEIEADQALFASLIDNAARYRQRVAVHLFAAKRLALRPTAFLRLRFKLHLSPDGVAVADQWTAGWTTVRGWHLYRRGMSSGASD